MAPSQAFKKLLDVALSPNAPSSLTSEAWGHLQSYILLEATGEELAFTLSAFDILWNEANLIKAEKAGFIPDEYIRHSGIFPCLHRVIQKVRVRHIALQEFEDRFLDRLDRLARWFVLVERSWISNDNSPFPLDFRKLLASNMIETMMCMKMFQRKLRSEIEKNTSMVKVAFRLWELEVTDSRFYNNEPHMHAVKITPFMIGVVRKEPHKVWNERIFSAFDREKKPASRIAKVALLHLEKSIAPRTFDVEKAEEDTELMLRLREHPEIQFAFHSQECFKLLIKALTVLTSKPLSAQTAKLFAKAIASCFMVIGFLLEFSDGAPWVIQFLEAGIIPAALNCAPWVPYFERQLDHDQVEYLFAHILPRYSMYKSVLKVIADKADKVEGWENAQFKLVGPGLSRFNDHWKIFVSMTKIRTPVLMKYHDMHMHRCAVADFCQKCGAVEHLKRCFGCFEVYYCSKECQTADWKSSHKAKCQRIQAIRKSGGTTEPSIDDILFAKRIIHCDLGTAPFAKEVLAAIPKTQPTDSTSSSNIIFLHIDYLDFPFTARARIGYNAQQSCGYHLKIVKDLESKARHSPSSDPNGSRYLVVKGWISRGYEQCLIFVSLPFNDQKRWEDLDMWVNPNALGPDDGDGCRDGKCKFVDVRMDSSAVI